jgi:hypothetical protein
MSDMDDTTAALLKSLAEDLDDAGRHLSDGDIENAGFRLEDASYSIRKHLDGQVYE